MNNRPFAGRTAAVIDLAKLRSNIANIKSRLKPGVEFIAVMNTATALQDFTRHSRNVA